MRVLVIEDERRLAENIARSVRESAGYAVDCAFDGENGLYMATSNPYDLIMVDLMYPAGTATLSSRNFEKPGRTCLSSS